MISINKEEARAVREHLPDAHITRTMKQKSKRGHYFCEESPAVVAFVNKLRSRDKALIRKYNNKPRGSSSDA